MTLHLTHALPWDTLNEAISVDQRNPNGGKKLVLARNNDDKGMKAWKSIQHFARCLETKVAEFRKTDKWSDVQKDNHDGRHNDDDEKRKFDLTTWGNFANMWCMPETMSVLCGYIQINMILLDETKWRPLLSIYSDAFQTCQGKADRGHPDWLAERFRQAFDKHDDKELLPMDVNLATILTEHAKQLFRIMYRSPPIEAEEIARLIARGMGMSNDVHKLTGRG